MERVRTLRQIEAELGLNYWTIRRWCRTNRIEHSRTPTGTLCLTESQINKLLRQMERNGNAHVGATPSGK